MQSCACFLKSSVGKKVIMAVTGVILLGFVVGHLAGNLLIYGGPSAFNAYAEKLRHMAGIVWVVRIVLLVALIVHVKIGALLAFQNQAARPQQYARKQYVEATEASRTMLLTGLLVLAFIIYHLAHFTFKTVHAQYAGGIDKWGRHNVFLMVVSSFKVPAISAAYVAAMFFLALHLSHGASVFLQTLGLNNAALDRKLRRAGMLLAWLIFVGYVSIPVSVLLGIIPDSAICCRIPSPGAK